jgi:Zn-dependent oligopeptidase|eukprot:5427375-Prymnesium_polylepis.4
MFENWSNHPAALRRVSKHYKTDEPIPDELMDALTNSLKANAAVGDMQSMYVLARAVIDQVRTALGPQRQPPLDP